jgi:propane monooxygenase reductase component
MGTNHTVTFEPVGIEIEVDEDETVLNAAFRQGVMLMHGCKEGQCSACKSFLLDGEVDMDRYSTFALPDYEQDEGWTLLCKAHAVSDLTVELINYDEEILRSGIALRTVQSTVVGVDELTHDIRRLTLKVNDAAGFDFHPGQYVDIRIPGSSEHRSFSMANIPSPDGLLEFMIKLYPGGHFSGLLADGSISPGDQLELKGPYGVFTLRDTDRQMVFIGGGAGMAPILSLVRGMQERGTTRRGVYYYGARTEADLFHLDELGALSTELPGFSFVPALSEGSDNGWRGEQGLITDVVDRLEPELQDVDAYLCGPPPMVDAAIALLVARGVPEAQIYFDKFTTTADTEERTQS